MPSADFFLASLFRWFLCSSSIYIWKMDGHSEEPFSPSRLGLLHFHLSGDQETLLQRVLSQSLGLGCPLTSVWRGLIWRSIDLSPFCASFAKLLPSFLPKRVHPAGYVRSLPVCFCANALSFLFISSVHIRFRISHFWVLSHFHVLSSWMPGIFSIIPCVMFWTNKNWLSRTVSVHDWLFWPEFISKRSSISIPFTILISIFVFYIVYPVKIGLFMYYHAVTYKV